MNKDREVVEQLLDVLDESGEKFIGPTVHVEARRCKYPGAWVHTLRRYTQLANDPSNKSSLYEQFYLDLCVTILYKRILTSDLHFISSGALETDNSRETTDMIIIHEIMFKETISRMLSCVCECVLKRPPVTASVATEQTAKLYASIASLLKERFYKNPETGNYHARNEFDLEKTVHDIVDNWLIHEALPNIISISKTVTDTAILPQLVKTRVLSDDPSFFAVAHCYWLWLHLTAAGIQTMKTENNFLALFYAFDLFIFCDHCSSHFEHHRPVFYTRDPYTGSVSTTYTAAELVFNVHNCVNKTTRKEILPAAVMSDYRAYWERCSLLDAGN